MMIVFGVVFTVMLFLCGVLVLMLTNQNENVSNLMKLNNKLNNITDLFVIGGGSSGGARKDIFNVSTSSIIMSGSVSISGSLSLNGISLQHYISAGIVPCSGVPSMHSFLKTSG